MIVNICSVPHVVLEKEDTFDVLAKSFGMIDYTKAEISINKNMPNALKQETLCHEMLHGMLVHIGRQDLSEDETFVQALGNAIYQGFNIKEV